MKTIEKTLMPSRYSILFFRRVNPRWIIFTLDMLICIFSVFLAYMLRFNFNINPQIGQNLYQVMVLVVSIRMISFLLARVSASIVRYTSIRDVFKVLTISSAGSLFLVALNVAAAVLGKAYPVPFSIIGIDFFATAFFMISYRLAVSLLYVRFSQGAVPQTKVVIYGSKEMAVLAKRALELDPKNHYKVVALISTSSVNTGKQVEGISIFALQDIEKVIQKYGVDQLLFANHRVDTEIEESIVQICLNNNVKVFNIPNVKDWINSSQSVRKMKELNIEDLLSRDPIMLDKKALVSQLNNKTILVTGAAGSIGSEIVRQIMQFSFKRLILIDQAETPMYNIGIELEKLRVNGSLEYIVADITSKQRMEKIFATYRPDIVYHAAAYKHVPMMECNPLEAIRNNVIGTKILADLSSIFKVSRFIFISTDKAVNPTNVMGASKRIAEMYVQALNSVSGTAFITTRFGNVLGSNGSVIPLFSKQIEAGGPVTVTHPEVTRFFMTIPEASQLVLEAGVCGQGGEIFIFNMGKSVKILDLAKKMIKLAGFEPGTDIQIQFTGLRPGEKLYEELLHQAEGTIPTHHPKLLIAKVREYDITHIDKRISVLEETIASQNALLLVREMKSTVPEFISQNSIFEEIDKELQYSDTVSSLKAV